MRTGWGVLREVGGDGMVEGVGGEKKEAEEEEE